MTPSQKLKKHLITECDGEFPSDVVTGEDIDLYWSQINHLLDWRWLRSEGVETDLIAPYDRNYQCRIHASEMEDGTWVAWPYWTGGGKHGDPGSIPWIEDAFEVETWTEPRTVRMFKGKMQQGPWSQT